MPTRGGYIAARNFSRFYGAGLPREGGSSNISVKIDSGFFKKVYALVAQIPAGKVASYGQIAAMAGAPRNARTVGYAMNGVPEGSGLPCHRVVYKDGGLAPEYAFGGSAVQRAALASEGVLFLADGRIDMEKCVWRRE